jgi:hypothetical protein
MDSSAERRVHLSDHRMHIDDDYEEDEDDDEDAEEGEEAAPVVLTEAAILTTMEFTGVDRLQAIELLNAHGRDPHAVIAFLYP